MPWKKYEAGKDELSVGDRVRLAGRIGEITSIDARSGSQNVEWDQDHANKMDLAGFPDLEIFVQPLTIPRKTKEELAKKYHDPAIGYEEFSDFIENLEVTED